MQDEGPGDGGVAVVQGSHKSNYPAPVSLKIGERWTQHVTEVHAKAGDIVIFCEACVHGALPWKGDHERRCLLYRFNPGHAAYTPGVAMLEYPSWVEEMTPEQQVRHTFCIEEQGLSRGNPWARALRCFPRLIVWFLAR